MEINKLKRFYKNKKIFLTGHTGFKGIWLYLILSFLDAKVVGFSLPLKNNDNFTFFKKNKKNFTSIFGNVLDYKKLSSSIKYYKPNIVFHLAAQSLVIESQKYPQKTFETNIVGTNNVIDVVKKSSSVKSLVIATSDKCYLNKGKKNFFDENSELGGVEPYSSSKSICEKLVNLYLKNYSKQIKFGLSTVRAGNVIGGGDFSKYRIVPDIVRNYYKKNIILRNPNHIRPWQNILDVCYAYVLIPIYHYKNKKKYSGPYNVGPLKRTSFKVSQLTKLLIKDFGVNYKIKLKKQKFTESKNLFLNSKKINKKLKWKPYFNIYMSSKNIVEWYKVYFNKKNLFKITNYQIKNYFYR